MSPPSVRCWISFPPPPLFLPSFLPSCYKLNALRRCCRLCLSHSFTRSRSLCPFFLTLTLTLRAHWLPSPSPPPPPLLSSSSSYITVSVQSVVLQHFSRVQPLEGGFLHACTRRSSQMETPSLLLCRPHLLLLPSIHVLTFFSSRA